MKLSTRLPLLFLLLSLVPILVIGTLSYIYAREALEEKIFDHLTATSIYKSANYRNLEKRNIQKLELLAGFPEVKEDVATLLTASQDGGTYEVAYQRLMDEYFLPILSDERFLSFSLLRPSDGLIFFSTEAGNRDRYGNDAVFFLEGQHGSYVDDVRYFEAEHGVV